MERRIIDMDCIVLAGGFGTRLQSIVSDVPKPMAPINGVPFLKIVLDNLSKKGLKKFTLSLGYKSECVLNFFANKQVSYSLQYAIEPEALGTGGAIALALQQVESKKVIIVNGDTFFDLDIQRFVDFSTTANSDCSLALKRIQNSSRYGSVRLSGNKITEFQEKTFREEALINTGVYCLDKEKFLEKKFPAKFSFEKEYLEPMAQQGKLAGLEMDAYFIDIGIPEDYQQAQHDFK